MPGHGQSSLQNYEKTTFVTCTIITKGGRGVTKHHMEQVKAGDGGRELVAMLCDRVNYARCVNYREKGDYL